MNNKKIFLFAFLSLFLVGCDSIGGVNLTDTKGNKYTFKNDSVNCRIDDTNKNSLWRIYCEGSAIKKDISGNRYVVEFSEKECVFQGWELYEGTLQRTGNKKLYTYFDRYFICSAANQLGKVDEVKSVLR